MTSRDAHALRVAGGAGGHMSTILSIACGEPGCDRTFGSESARDSHLQYQHRIGIVDPLGYPCRVSTCTSTFGTAANRDEHMLDAHRSAPAAKRLDAAGARAPDSARAVLTAPVATQGTATDEVDTSDDLSEDAGSSPAPRSQEQEEPAMAEEFMCQMPGCGRSFGSKQALGGHVSAAHRKDAAGKAPPHAQNGRRSAGPVIVKFDPLTLDLLIELVVESGPDALALDDPEELRREAGRLQLLAVLQEASPA